MSTLSPHLTLPLLEELVAGESTHDAALAIIDTTNNLAVLDRDLTTPPGDPTEGDRYFVPTGATGAWASNVHDIATWDGSAWSFLTPAPGWRMYVVDEGLYLYWNGAALASLGGGAAGSAGVVERGAALLTVNNSNAWENLLSFTIPGGTLLTDEGYRLWLLLELVNQTGAPTQTLDIRMTLDGTTIFSGSEDYPANSNNATLIVEHTLLANGSATSKKAFGRIIASQQSVSSPPAAAGDFGTGKAGAPHENTLSVVTSSDVDLEVDCRFSSADPASFLHRRFYYVQQLF